MGRILSLSVIHSSHRCSGRHLPAMTSCDCCCKWRAAAAMGVRAHRRRSCSPHHPKHVVSGMVELEVCKERKNGGCGGDRQTWKLRSRCAARR